MKSSSLDKRLLQNIFDLVKPISLRDGVDKVFVADIVTDLPHLLKGPDQFDLRVESVEVLAYALVHILGLIAILPVLSHLLLP